jgi:DNA-binding CsgD family transcriptional regulator
LTIELDMFSSDNLRSDLEHKSYIVRFEIDEDKFLFYMLEPTIRSFEFILDHTIADNLNSGKEKLSKRELQVLILLAEGYSSKDIANMLTKTDGDPLSQRTIETYRGKIKEKLNIGKRPQLVSYVNKFLRAERQIVLIGVKN